MARGENRGVPCPATLDDAAEVADVYLSARADALPYLRRIHSDDSVRTWVRETLLTRGETWITRSDGRIVGFLCLAGEDVDQLYVLPGWYGRGIGSMLLQKAKQRSPNRLRLFTFRRNQRAVAFYEAHGFTAVDYNNGSRNEEGEPDVQFEWRGRSAPLVDSTDGSI